MIFPRFFGSLQETRDLFLEIIAYYLNFLVFFDLLKIFCEFFEVLWIFSDFMACS